MHHELEPVHVPRNQRIPEPVAQIAQRPPNLRAITLVGQSPESTRRCIAAGTESPIVRRGIAIRRHRDRVRVVVDCPDRGLPRPKNIVRIVRNPMELPVTRPGAARIRGVRHEQRGPHRPAATRGIRTGVRIRAVLIITPRRIQEVRTRPRVGRMVGVRAHLRYRVVGGRRNAPADHHHLTDTQRQRVLVVVPELDRFVGLRQTD